MSQGYSLPLSPTGRASLVPSPPWHYVGDFVVVDYWADPAAVAAVLPPGMEPYAADPGRAAVIFADWQSCTTDQNELVDPARSQYKEAFIVVNAMLGDEHVTTCPYIWVDRDFALVRGWIQGFPKKLGSIWMTRTFGLGTLADPAVAGGSTFGGTMAANDRRLLEATGNRVMSFAMNTLQAAFLRSLADDYARWAADAGYREARERSDLASR